MELNSHKLSNDDAIAFITGGNATFTIKNLIDNSRYTFKATTPPNQDAEEKTILFVYLLTGPNNTKDYTYIGHIKIQGSFIQFHVKTTYKVDSMSPSVTTLNAALIMLQSGIEMEYFEVWHEGRCCRCGRTLTVPESIASGIGPECAIIKAVYQFSKLNSI